MTVLLEQCIDTRNTAVPAVLEILQGQAAVLSIGFLPLHGILRPNTGGIKEFSFPRLQISIQVRNKLIGLVRHPGTEVSNCEGHEQCCIVKRSFGTNLQRPSASTIASHSEG